jgi:uncharacterized protein YdhG (YjbR/CyaY superfamily)
MDMSNESTIDAYIQSFPEETQAVLADIRKAILRSIPDTTEAISYGIPTFKFNDKYVIYFAGYEHHVSVYPIPKGNAELQKQIEPFIAGKGTLRFPLDQPVPYDLIARVAVELLAENQARTAAAD